MSNEPKKDDITPSIAVIAFIAFGLLLLVVALGGGAGVFLSIVFFVVGVFSILLGILVITSIEDEKQRKARKIQREADKIADMKLLKAAVIKHKVALKRNLKQAFKINDYGACVADNCGEVIKEFLESCSIELEQLSIPQVVDHVENLIAADDAGIGRKTGFNPDILPDDGHDFEHWVADSLTKFGWDAEVTQGSGDQGIDVIARRGGKTVAIQCKLYSKPVGNKAVQEAYSGAKHYGAQYAAVITNAGFTPSAKDLAISTQVILLLPDDIPTFQV